MKSISIGASICILCMLGIGTAWGQVFFGNTQQSSQNMGLGDVAAPSAHKIKLRINATLGTSPGSGIYTFASSSTGYGIYAKNDPSGGKALVGVSTNGYGGFFRGKVGTCI